jgi:hypothetical protein
MESILHTTFIMRYDFYQGSIKQHSSLKYISSNNDDCLVEDIETKTRLWVMKRDIYPLNNDELYKIWENSI